jgi:hypothetical protein
VGDIAGPEAEERELAHHVVTGLGADTESTGAILAEASHRIRDGGAVDPGVEEEPPRLMDDEERGDGYRPARPGLAVRHHQRELEIEIAAAECVDA